MEDSTQEVGVAGQSEDLEVKKQALQELFNNERFRRAITAHRLIDMSVHSGNIYAQYPDYSPPPDALRQLQVATKGIYRFTPEEIQAFTEEMYKMGKTIRGSWQFAAAQDTQGTFYITAGHPVRYLPYGDEKGIKSMRGMFIRLGDKFNGDYVVQLDSGRSRQLYDGSDHELLNKKLISKIADGSYSHYEAKGWIDNLDSPNPLLVVCNAEFQIEDLIQINKYRDLSETTKAK